MISIATSKKEQFLVPRVLQKAHLALGQASGVSQQLQEANKEDPRGCHGSLTVVAAVVSLDLGLPWLCWFCFHLCQISADIVHFVAD